MTTKRPRTSPPLQAFLASPRLQTPRSPLTPSVPVYSSLQEYSPYASSAAHHFYVLGFRAPLALFRRETHAGVLTAKPRSEGRFDSKQYLLRMLARKKKSLLADVEKTIDSAYRGGQGKETISASAQGIVSTKSAITLRKANKGISLPLATQTRSLTPTPPVLPAKASLKEACKDREWTLKARDQLSKDWAEALRLSNGVQIEACGEGYGTFTYFLDRGNNHQLVSSCFRSRGWVKLEGEEGWEDAHVVWTQSKMQDLYEYYPRIETLDHMKVAAGKSLLCTVKFQPKYLPTKGRYVEISPLGYDLVTQSPSFAQLSPTLALNPQVLETHNKLEHNEHLTNKKSLLLTLRQYYEVTNGDLFSVIPVTFHLANGQLDSEFEKFRKEYTYFDPISQEMRLKGVWILKPGENTNRGNGISVCYSLPQLTGEISTYTVCPISGQKRTFILQKYLENPYLVNKRKFDIRCYTLVTSINGVVQAYFYREGYLRTSSKEFSLRDGNKFVHLTNDAVQKHAEDYGKFETGNKLSYADFQRYLDANTPGVNVYQDIVRPIRALVQATISASFLKLDSAFHQYSFELLGYDFMLDSALKPWLIEVNTNPCLETSSPLLARLIPAMLDNAFRIAVDPYYPESPFVAARKAATSREGLVENLFELIFSSTVDGEGMKRSLGERIRLIM